MRKKRRPRSKKNSRLRGLIPLGIVLVVFLTAVFVVKAGWLPNDVFAQSSSDWSPRAMYENYLGEYKEALANRVKVAEEVKKLGEEASSRFRELLKEAGCSSAITYPCSVRDGFVIKVGSNGRYYNLMNNDIWSPYSCDKVDCEKIRAQRAAEEMRIKSESKYSNSPYNFWKNFLRITKIQLPQSISISKNEAYQTLSTLNSIVITTDADSLRNLQSALNAFDLPYKAEDLTPPSMDLLRKWRISADYTDLMLEYWSGASGWVEWSKSSSGKDIFSFHKTYYMQGKKVVWISAICPPLQRVGRVREQEICIARFSSVIKLADFRIAKDLETT